MIGACGAVGSTVALGIVALKKKLIPTNVGTTGLVSALQVFESADLIDPGSIVVGGHEIRSQTLTAAVAQSHIQSGLFDADLIKRCSPGLRSFQKNIRPGTLYGVSKTVRGLARDDDATAPLSSPHYKGGKRGVERPTPVDECPTAGSRQDACATAAVERLAADLAAFKAKHRLGHVVVVNVASCEPRISKTMGYHDYGKLTRAMAKKGAAVMPASCISALAAIEAGCSFINFTPSAGIAVPAIRQRADNLGTSYMGRDGKTGETLVKSVLAPMFATRNLKLLSWVSHNILGNRDGKVLSDPKTRAAKIKSKDHTISPIVGYQPKTHISIEYINSLDDWKTAWDFVHFQGFLGTKMQMQFTWQGSDSVLAAPLIIDLVRLVALEHRRGGIGPMKHLACFFKDPMGVTQRNYFAQWRALVEHVVDS